jgi:hypothetical protein
MSGKRLFLIISLIYLLGFFAHALFLKKNVYGDGIFYYSWVRSIVVDHDINFRNEYERFGVNQIQAPTSLVGNKHSIGPALLWLAPFWWTHQIVRGSGYELPYQLHVGATSVFFVLFGLILLYWSLHKLFGQAASLLTTLAIAGATNLLFYGSIDTVNSHGVSFFASALFLTFLLNRQALSAGLALGFLGSIRHQDIILGIIALGILQKKELVRFIVGAIVGFLPQLLAWQFLYGIFWNIPYFAAEGFNLLQPHILEILFSTKFGLFTYSPILILGFFGFLFWRNKLRIPIVVAILLQLVAISSWSTWWQGASYGIRMFVGSLPMAAIGIAAMLQHLLKKKILSFLALSVLIATLAGLNVLLIAFFLLSS